MESGKWNAAAKWYYVGQMRFGAHLNANPSLTPSGDPALYSSLKYVVGTPINRHIGQDPDNWVKTIDQAIDWNAANDNSFTPKQAHKEIYVEIEQSFKEFRNYVIDVFSTFCVFNVCGVSDP